MRHILLLAAAFALAACDSGGDATEVEDSDGDGQLSAEEIEDQMGSAMSRGDFLSPGEWESSISVERIEMPGITEQQRETMKQAMGGQTFRTCLTQAEVEQPDERFFTGSDTDCTYNRFSIEDGRIDSEMVCNVEGMSQRMTLSGEYGAERYDLTMEADSLSDDGITMAMRIEARRIGECSDG